MTMRKTTKGPIVGSPSGTPIDREAPDGPDEPTKTNENQRGGQSDQSVGSSTD